jgi:hypothetical protein
MTAATLTASATAADLLDELSQLLGRHNGASTLEEIRELADELSTVLRRTRGRIQTLARRELPAPEPAAEKPEPPAAEARTIAPETERPAPPPAPPPRPTFAAPLPPPRPVVIEIRPDKPAPDPAPAVRPAEMQPAPHRREAPAVVRLVVAVLVALWATVRPAAKPMRRLVRAVYNAACRGLDAARPYVRRVRLAARRELDRWLQ